MKSTHSASREAPRFSLGAHEKGVEGENDPGHAWVAFGRSVSEMEFRGYYPLVPGVDFTKIEAEPGTRILDCIVQKFNLLFSSRRQFAKYFSENDVDGLVLRDPIRNSISNYHDRIDRTADEYQGLLLEILRNRLPKPVPFFAKEISIKNDSHNKLMGACHIPPGLDAIMKGRYGLRIHQDGVNNCVSWACRTTKGCVSEMQEVPIDTYSIKELVGWIVNSLDYSGPLAKGSPD